MSDLARIELPGTPKLENDITADDRRSTGLPSDRSSTLAIADVRPAKLLKGPCKVQVRKSGSILDSDDIDGRGQGVLDVERAVPAFHGRSVTTISLSKRGGVGNGGRVRHLRLRRRIG